MPDSLGVRVTFALTAWMLSVVSSSSSPANSLPDIKNEDFIKDCVRMHNKFRSAVTPAASDMLYMTWDPLLAQIAKAWASHCEFAHNQQLKPPHKLHPNFTSLGENLWTGSLSIFSVSSAITDWYDEVKYYDFKTRKCNKVCGHYTQVVWADSYKVGCAVHFCPQVSGFRGLLNGAHFICNYGPAVSDIPSKGLRALSSPVLRTQLRTPALGLFLLPRTAVTPLLPVTSGLPDLQQPEQTPLRHPSDFTANPQRDKVTRYYSTVFPDWPIYPRDRNTSLFLIIIPPILILSVIIIMWAKGKYPHLFTLK
nr:glioma pathogenesis-related protein 1 [Odocoileus virginianus texanus]